jgi:hypothetical protein
MAEFEGVKLWLNSRSQDFARDVTGYLKDIGKLEKAKARYTEYLGKLNSSKPKSAQTAAWIEQMSAQLLDMMADIDRELSHRKHSMDYTKGMSSKLEQAAQGLR